MPLLHFCLALLTVGFLSAWSKISVDDQQNFTRSKRTLRWVRNAESVLEAPCMFHLIRNKLHTWGSLTLPKHYAHHSVPSSAMCRMCWDLHPHHLNCFMPQLLMYTDNFPFLLGRKFVVQHSSY